MKSQTTQPTRAKTLVLLCDELARRGRGVDLTELGGWLQEQDAFVQVEVVVGLCHERSALSDAPLASAAQLVLGVCSADYDLIDAEADIRKAGLDPLGVEAVNLGGYCARPYPPAIATERAKTLLAGAVARARAFPGSKPEHVRPRVLRGRQKVSRRSLFTLPPIRYQPVAAIDLERCVSEGGCQLCVDACPYEALAKQDSRVSLDKNRCQACGICVVECPRRAIELPTASLPQLEAQLTALLRANSGDHAEPRAILFVCDRNADVLEGLSRNGLSYPPEWLPVHVPCTGMVSSSWLLSCLAWGADAVGVLACGTGCRHRQEGKAEGAAEYCREVFAMMGGSPDSVRLLYTSSETALAEELNRPMARRAWRPVVEPEHPAFSGSVAAAQALLRLVDDFGAAGPLSFGHAFSPLGLVHIDEEKCTACGGCARACPSDALAMRQEADGMSLVFDPARCTGCGLCAALCPEASEQAIRVDLVTDLQKLSAGAASLYDDQEVRCESCGTVVGPAAMLRRVETILAAEAPRSSAGIAAMVRRCPSCRGLGMGTGIGAAAAGATTKPPTYP